MFVLDSNRVNRISRDGMVIRSKIVKALRPYFFKIIYIKYMFHGQNVYVSRNILVKE